MLAMVIKETGGPEVLQAADLPVPTPGPGEIRVRIAYAGVNPADWKNRQGMLEMYRPYVFPYVIGFDAAGIVDALGEGVTDFNVGDRVLTPTNHGQGGQGSYAEYALASVDRVAVIPDGLDFKSASALPVAALTSWQALFVRGQLQPKQKILIHGGSGGLGSFAVQFAKNAGADVAATCSTPNVDYLVSLGVDRVIDYRAEDVMSAVSDWAPNGLDFLLDAVGASSLPNALDLVRSGGTFVSIPTLVDDGDIPAAVAASAARGINRIFSTMTDVDCAPQLAIIMEQLVAGNLTLPPITEYALDDVASAHRQLETGHTRGKCVLKVADL